MDVVLLSRRIRERTLYSAQYLASGINGLYHSGRINDEAERCLCNVELLLVVFDIAYNLSSKFMLNCCTITNKKYSI